MAPIPEVDTADADPPRRQPLLHKRRTFGVPLDNHLLCAHNDGMMVLADPVACEGAAKRQPVMGGRDQLGIE
jgi:hypothetical protein